MKSYVRVISLFLAVLTVVTMAVMAVPAAAAGSPKRLSLQDYRTRYSEFLTKKDWKDGARWYGNKKDGHKPPVVSNYSCGSCYAYAADFAAVVYEINPGKAEKGKGSCPWNHSFFKKFTNVNDIKTGDVIHTYRTEKNEEGKTVRINHWFVVLERKGNELFTAEGNYENRVRASTKTAGYLIENGKLYLKVGNSKYLKNFSEGYHYSFAPEFKVRFDANGGTGSMADHTATYGYNVKTPSAAFTKKGYAFNHWTVSRSSDNKYYCVEKVQSGDKEKGVWYAENEIPSNYKKKEYPNEYSFCWATLDPTEVITVHAEWKRIGNYFTVSYHPNGGKGTMEDTTVIYGVDTKLPEATFTKDGYGVAGWNVYRKSDGKWLYRRNNKAEGGKWCVKGKEPKGYTLAVYKNGTTLAKTSKVNGDEIQLYAVWKKAFTVEYDANGGTGAMEDTVVVYGQNTKIPQCTFTRDGYKFKGWNVYRESDGKWVYRRNNSTVNAKWCKEGQQPSGYTLGWYKDGTTVAKTSSVAGDTVRFVAVWEKVGGTAGSNNQTSQTPTKPKEEQKPTEPKEEQKPTTPKEEDQDHNSGTTNTTPPVEEQEKPVEKVCTLAVQNLYLPPAKLSTGSAFTVSGVVTSKDTITSVTIRVKDANTGKVAFSGTAQPNSKSYSLFNLDSKMTFSKLAAGKYVLEVIAKDSVGEKTLVKHEFTRVASNITSSNMVYPSGTLTKGKTFRVSGKVSSADKISKVELSVHTTDGKKMFSGTANPNAANYDVYGLDSKMTFKQLPAGKYIYRVAVTDGKGVTRYAVSMSFTVK